MRAMLIRTETTPNPRTLMFLLDGVANPGEPAEFADADAAEATPVARALFALGDVERVLIARDHVAVTRAMGAADWPELRPLVIAAIADHAAQGLPFAIAAGEEDALADDPADADIVAQIRQLLDDRVRPAVAGDGGDIVYRGFHRGVVSLRMKGACSGCPSSTATLKAGIESLLRHYVPEVTEVRAV
jgi:Fe-S cluster biogenesis protein NfuA